MPGATHEGKPVVAVRRGWPGENSNCFLPASHDTWKVAIHVTLSAPPGMTSVPVKVALNNRDCKELSLKRDGRQGPAVIKLAACAPSRLAASLFLEGLKSVGRLLRVEVVAGLS